MNTEYDFAESQAEEMSCAQIEYDQSVYYKTTPPTSADIYAMSCESEIADRFAKWLCKAAGVDFPPINESQKVSRHL